MSSLAFPRLPTVDRTVQALPSHLAQAVWSGRALSGRQTQVLSSGMPELDAELPGGGWPGQALTEVLQPQAGLAEWRLLLPALQAWVARGGVVMLVAPPWRLHAPALCQEGLPSEAFIWVDADAPAERLWATEQVLKAEAPTAVLSWLPQAQPAQIRRLQACASRHAGPVFLFRPATAQGQASAAPLRLHLSLGPCPHPLQVRVFKRRGPLQDTTLTLPCWPRALRALWPAQAESAPTPATRPAFTVSSHGALDRPAARTAGHAARVTA